MLSPVLLWLDLYEKCERGSRRRELLKNVTKALKWMHESHEDRFAGNVRSASIHHIDFAVPFDHYPNSGCYLLCEVFLLFYCEMLFARFTIVILAKKWIPHPQLIQNQLNRAFFDGKDKCTFKMQRYVI